jgi:hypothetical protein
VRMPVLDRFLFDGRFRVLGEAHDDRGAPLAYAFAWHPLERVDGGLPEVSAALGPWRTDFTEVRRALANPPAGLTHATGHLAVALGKHQRIQRPRREAPIAPETSLRFAVPPELVHSAEVRLELAYGTSGERAVWRNRAKELAVDERIDLGAALPPRISAALAEDGEAGRRTVRLSFGGEPRGDLALVRLAWPRTREHVWTVVAPPTTSTVRLPALPPELEAWRPDDRPVSVAAALVEASFYDGYADVRRKGVELLFDPRGDDGVRVTASVTGELPL